MSRAIIIAKLRRQKAEINEIVAELKEEGISPKIIELVTRVKQDANTLIEALLDKSLIPRDYEELDVEPEVKKLEKKLGKTKEKIQRIKELERERERLEEEIEKGLEEE